MDNKEKVIVSLTSYGRRLLNLPAILETIFTQTQLPDLVVLNLASEESIPSEVMNYLCSHNIEINRVPDNKVYKKLLPTLRKYPESCVISIDDDFLYPQNMIKDFLTIHKRHPNNPISGNREVFYGMQCHCGCASLTKASFFGDFLDLIGDEIINNCPSDDMVYTFFATKSGFPYLQTEHEYFLNMTSYKENQENGYSNSIGGDLGVKRTYRYLVEQFGEINGILSSYIHDDDLAKVIENIQTNMAWQNERQIRSSHAYRLGKFLLKPLSLFRER